jgi:hypothetical protein
MLRLVYEGLIEIGEKTKERPLHLQKLAFVRRRRRFY